MNVLVEEGTTVPPAVVNDDMNQLPQSQAPPHAPAPQLKDKPLRERMTLAVGGFLLSVNAGFINGVCYAAVNGYPVSHVSGTTTKAGLHAAAGQGDKFGVDVGLISCFTIGSAISGFVMPGNNFRLTNGYGPLFIISSSLLFLACALQASMPDSVHYFYVAAMACGLQNAMTTKYSGSIIRTTHVTGTFTELRKHDPQAEIYVFFTSDSLSYNGWKSNANGKYFNLNVRNASWWEANRIS